MTSTQPSSWNKAAAYIHQVSRIALLTLPHPDSDRITTMLALTRALENINKEVSCVLPDPLPKHYFVLPITRSIVSRLDTTHRYRLALPIRDNQALNSIDYERRNNHLFIHLETEGALPERGPDLLSVSRSCDLAIVIGIETQRDIATLHNRHPAIVQTPIVALQPSTAAVIDGAHRIIVPPGTTYTEAAYHLLAVLQQATDTTPLVDDGVATTLLAGIIAATDHLQHTTTPTSLHAISHLLTAGADYATALSVHRSLIETEKQPAPTWDEGVHALYANTSDSLVVAHVVPEARHALAAVIDDLQQRFPGYQHAVVMWDDPHDEHPALPRTAGIMSSQSPTTLDHIAAATEGSRHKTTVQFVLNTTPRNAHTHIADLLKQQSL